MREKTLEQIKGRIGATERERKRVLDLVAKGLSKDAEDDGMRNSRFEFRQTQMAALKANIPLIQESLQGETNDLQPVAFLNEGSSVRRAVGKIEVDRDNIVDLGTGFLISPQLFLTNQHVISNNRTARSAVISFDYEVDETGRRKPTSIFNLDPEKFEFYSDEADLDFALIALGKKVQGPASPEELGYSPISNTADRHRKGMNVNVIQHPGGYPKSIAIRKNIVSARTNKYLLYSSDTLKGSSGAPVYNDDWDVVALHHYGAPSEERDEDGAFIEKEVNEGIRISAIYDRLTEALPNLPQQQQKLLEEALMLFERPMSNLPTIERRVVREEFNKPKGLGVKAMTKNDNNHDNNQEMTFIVPIEITVRIPNAQISSGTNTLSTLTGDNAGQKPNLKIGEGKRLDRNYSNRNGFNESFLRGLRVSIGSVLAPVAEYIHPLKDREEDSEEGVLKYQNFSVVMNQETRLALITATNIDGHNYKKIDRATGDLAEGESWYIERRIDRDAFLDQSFYSEWSHIMDRGHLTRRNDPTWGTAEEAKRANADTFHFTNCSPQQWRFNQSVKFWQGIERYILENGVSNATRDNRVSVLQGPLFSSGVSGGPGHWAGDVRIPVEFWKLVLWRKGNTKKAVALIASQEEMLEEVRRGGRREKYDPNADVNVEEFRVSVAELSMRTGMDFSAFESFDTISSEEAPHVAEVGFKIPVNQWQDIVL